MAGDDLDSPLIKPAKAGSRQLGPIIALLTVVGIGGAALAIYQKANGSRGEPFAVATIEHSSPTASAAPSPAPVAPAPDTLPTGTAQTPPARADDPMRAAGQDVQIENGVKVIRPISASGSGPVTLKVPGAEAKRPAAADARVVEAGPSGPLPKVGSDGSRPADVYAIPGEPADGRPRIAILLSGMGLDQSVTAEAARSLPAAVTLGFAPYGQDLEAQVRQGRESGHEAVLLLPMEDFGRDTSLSHLLLDTPAGNQERLHWLMSRFTGYAGVGNYLGGRLLGDEAALQPLLREIAARGLYFVDDGRSPRSLAGAVAADVALPALRADVVIDAKPDPTSILAALAQLEKLARERGFALGTAVGMPATNGLLERFTAGLQARGLALVPVSQALVAPAHFKAGAVQAPPKP